MGRKKNATTTNSADTTRPISVASSQRRRRHFNSSTGSGSAERISGRPIAPVGTLGSAGQAPLWRTTSSWRASCAAVVPCSIVNFGRDSSVPGGNTERVLFSFLDQPTGRPEAHTKQPDVSRTSPFPKSGSILCHSATAPRIRTHPSTLAIIRAPGRRTMPDDAAYRLPRIGVPISALPGTAAPEPAAS